MPLNLEQARFNMIEQQVRTWDVLDPAVLEVLGSVPREDFVPARYRKLAFADLRIALGFDQVMMKPLEEGRMLQALAINPGENVLEIGTGSGFTAACLAALGGQVSSVEIVPELADSASRRLERAGFGAVSLQQGDALAESTLEGLFDVLVVTGSCAAVPASIKRLVSPGGRVFAVIGHAPAMEAVCLRHCAPDRWLVESLFETNLPRLTGAEDRPVFEF